MHIFAISCLAYRLLESTKAIAQADKPFLAVNGIQTLSHDYLNLAAELPTLQKMGIGRFRLSPHSCDMVAVADIFRAMLGRAIDAPEANARLEALALDAPFSNGFFHGKPGYRWQGPAAR
ncbi:hypothetical protein MXD81_64445 [Microbacteriaceae bacterium K1510]|nr:hypothetical protein [Microbacteriaceae bacterium K1510]